MGDLRDIEVRAIAANGRAALSMLQEDAAFDVVLMDLQMPVMNGFEATAAIRAAEVVEDLTRSLPSGSDIVDVEALREDGKVVIEFGQSLLEADPQVLEDTMRAAAARARDAIPDLEDVEFRVGDRTFTY